MASEENRAPRKVRRMFDRISPRYDLLNHLLSLNLDRRWRRVAAAALPPDPRARILDLCGGTGDLTLELARGGRAGQVVCCDFSHGMLLRARTKFRRRGRGEGTLLQADGLRLPLPAERFDALAIAFGLRNLVDRRAGLAEMHRVLKRDGRLVVLEFSHPTAPVLAPAYRFYLRCILPRVGDGVSGQAGPYGYLARTIGEFPAPAELAAEIAGAGFADCRWSGLSGGIVALHTATRR